MGKLFNETHQQYRDRVVNAISPSYCGAKWYNATVWLGSGMTASCHHPQAHHIPLEELQRSYKALHNTEYKKKVRQQMLDGVRPKECEYCWKVEDISTDLVSDRVYKSIIYTDEDHLQAKEGGADQDVDLKTLEIAFDSLCNLACSYCSPQFSSTYAADIRKNGPYQNLVSDGAGAYQHDGSFATPYGIKNENNPYVDAFIKWWNADLQHSLNELRVTGGEATMSPGFWAFADSLSETKCDVRFAVNSNLSSNPKLIQRLCGLSSKFKEFEIYTSCESVGPHAEYIRDGLEWDNWLSNVELVLQQESVNNLHIMMTINALCLFSMTEFIEQMLTLRKKYNKPYSCAMSFNILRFPSFQSMVTLPVAIRHERANHIENWLRSTNFKGNGWILHQTEYDGITRIVKYLREDDSKHATTISSYGGGSISDLDRRQKDFKSFYSQYDERLGKSILKDFPMLEAWWNTVTIQKTIPIKMATVEYAHNYEKDSNVCS